MPVCSCRRKVYAPVAIPLDREYYFDMPQLYIVGRSCQKRKRITRCNGSAKYKAGAPVYKINIRPSFRGLYERPSLAPSHKINTRRSFACLYERPSLAPALEPTTAAYYSYTLYCLTDWPERWTRAAAAAAVRDFAKTLVISKLKMEETYFLGVSLIRHELVVLIDTEPGEVGYTSDADAGIVTPAPLQGRGAA